MKLNGKKQEVTKDGKVEQIERDEKVRHDVRLEVVNRLLTNLDQQELYYTDSRTIARLVHEQLKLNSKALTLSEKEAFDGLDSKDIYILLSYRSSCC